MKNFVCGLLISTIFFFCSRTSITPLEENSEISGETFTVNNDSTIVNDSSKVRQLYDGTILIDIHGKRWDVTHAVEKYNFKMTNFQYGIGVKAIQPILDPAYHSPGDSGYPARDLDFLVIGFSQSETPRAYPLSVMSRHEVVDDVNGNQEIAICYCPLVQLAAVYNRRIADSAITLAASGWTYDYTFVLYDHETESLWYPLPGTTGLTCISGYYADRVLEQLPSFKTRWKYWVNEHPNSQILVTPIRP